MGGFVACGKLETWVPLFCCFLSMTMREELFALRSETEQWSHLPPIWVKELWRLDELRGQGSRVFPVPAIWNRDRQKNEVLINFKTEFFSYQTQSALSISRKMNSIVKHSFWRHAVLPYLFVPLPIYSGWVHRVRVAGVAFTQPGPEFLPHMLWGRPCKVLSPQTKR